MDEPLSGLDTPSQDNLLELLGILKQKGVTVMVATHDLDQAVNYFDQILLLNKRVIAFGPADLALTPESLSEAYGGRLKIENGKIIPDTCCDGDLHE
jgi:ABC-type Mn2+/Zn2+ transport system ATPase subunit